MAKTESSKYNPAQKDCLKCLKIKNKKNGFYSTSSNLYSDGKYPICKNCLWEQLPEENPDDPNYLEAVQSLLADLNKPFLYQIWLSSINESQKSNKDLFGIYMKNIIFNFRDLTWKDSEFNITPEEKEGESAKGYYSDGLDELKDLYEYWGKGYSTEDYQFLEREKIKLMSSFECPDYGMEMIMRDICFINLDIEKTRRMQTSNSSSQISKLIKTRSDLMNDAKMKPIQATGAEANDQISFGVLVKKWENDKPIPPALDDEMKIYIDTFMVGHLAKMEGLDNELTRKYDEALAQYTIDFKDLKQFDNDEEE